MTAAKPLPTGVMECHLRKLRPRGLDADQAFAAALAGRRYEDAATTDGYVDLAYSRRFRPYRTAPIAG